MHHFSQMKVDDVNNNKCIVCIPKGKHPYMLSIKVIKCFDKCFFEQVYLQNEINKNNNNWSKAFRDLQSPCQARLKCPLVSLITLGESENLKCRLQD